MAETLGVDPGLGISGYGTTIAGGSAGPIGMVTKITINGQEVDMLNVTTMNSPGRWKQFIAGLKDAKDIGLELVYHRKNMTLVLGLLGGANDVWTIVFPDGSTFVQSGFFKKLGTTVPDDDKITQSATLQMSGAPVWHEAS